VTLTAENFFGAAAMGGVEVRDEASGMSAPPVEEAASATTIPSTSSSLAAASRTAPALGASSLPVTGIKAIASGSGIAVTVSEEGGVLILRPYRVRRGSG
jgi:hypothetical protein